MQLHRKSAICLLLSGLMLIPLLANASGICPQQRTTPTAPGSLAEQKNPLPNDNKTIEKGRLLYHETARPTTCKMCHGMKGNGNGRLAPGLEPPPRNFTCAKTMNSISDGQLFWIIQNGPRRTAMPAHRNTLSNTQIWELVQFIRTFSK
jgi:mono/diheme cytochrome c family protein